MKIFLFVANSVSKVVCLIGVKNVNSLDSTDVQEFLIHKRHFRRRIFTLNTRETFAFNKEKISNRNFYNEF